MSGPIRILWASTQSNNVHTVMHSLSITLGERGHIKPFFYDERWNQTALQLAQSNPRAKDVLQSHGFKGLPLIGIDLPRERVAMDTEMLNVAKGEHWDLILYTSAWEGLFVPSNETLRELNKIAPVVHLLFDGSDPPWWEQLLNFERDDCFLLTVNIDGGHYWPGGRDWNFTSQLKKALTLLTPLDTRMFQGISLPYSERPYQISYVGNAGGWVRSEIVRRLHQLPNFYYRQRDDNPNSYANFAQALCYSQVIINVPFTGSNATKHVKGRVVEAGMAGCALLEWKNDATRSWFPPRQAFQEYESVEECIDMARWMAGKPKMCADMADVLRTITMTEHNPGTFWHKVFGGVGIDLRAVMIANDQPKAEGVAVMDGAPESEMLTMPDGSPLNPQLGGPFGALPVTVETHNQSGGITAAVVNVGEIETRDVSEDLAVGVAAQ